MSGASRDAREAGRCNTLQRVACDTTAYVRYMRGCNFVGDSTNYLAGATMARGTPGMRGEEA